MSRLVEVTLLLHVEDAIDSATTIGERVASAARMRGFACSVSNAEELDPFDYKTPATVRNHG